MILNINGDHDDKTLEQLEDVDSRAVFTALMADGHLGYIMPIGGVAAYRQQVSPVGVGFDIACGNAAAKTDLTVDYFEGELEDFADEIFDYFAFGVGRVNESIRAPYAHDLFEDVRWDLIPEEHREPLREKARRQLGTIGSGNHYVDLLVDEEGFVWVGVHFGSRGFGWTIASTFLALSQGGEWGDRGKEQEILLDVGAGSPLGDDYWALMNLAGEYAYAGRDWVVDEVLRMLGAQELDRVHNHHNFAWEESHFGDDYIVVRKGATPAFPGQRGFVGGSMGDDAVILRGATITRSEQRDTAEDNLYSTVHGAGRVMGRRAAKRSLDPNEVKAWLDDVGVIKRGGDLDEAPQAYRRLPDVLEAQGATVEVEHTLTPIIACMAE